MSATFVDVNGIKSAIAEVRNDRSATNWVLLSYQGENSNNIHLIGKGEGGPSELIDLLEDNQVGYGLIRLVEKRDDSDTVKFVFVKWIGEDIHRMLRARLGTHSGAIKEIISPYHVDVEATTKDEITEDIIVSKIRKASGTAVHVIDRPGQGGSSSGSAPKSPHQGSTIKVSSPLVSSGVNQASGGVSFSDKAALVRAIADVRNDSSSTNWVLASYEGANSNTIVLVGSGDGGSEELLGHLRDDNVGYGLIRQSEKFDDNSRVMFAFVNWTGENIHRMLRARLGTHSGAVKELFSPYHVSITATNESEISENIITTTIRETMGTASKVRN